MQFLNRLAQQSVFVVVAGLLVILLAVWKYDVNLSDWLVNRVADRVIERLEADYMPYGPQFQDQAQDQVAPQQTPQKQNPF